jgi:choline-sulfatase
VRTNQLDFDEEVSFVSRRKLFEIARGRDERPFFLVVSLTHPHDPFAIPRRYWDLYADGAVPMPRLVEPADDPHSRRLRHVWKEGLEQVTDEHIRAARHAYLGSISFVDEQFGLILEALEDIGAADDTIVLVIGDHGEMLGERGLWYKMSFFEGAARIPMIVHAPGRFAPRRVAASVSLVDILPTLGELGGISSDFAAPPDGRSLVPHLAGEAGPDEVIGEYLGEGAIAPIVMIRRGRWKFVHSPADPDQLYDLESDPDERTNRAADAACAPTVAAFRAEVADRWDMAALHEAVLASQRRRRLVAASNARGTLASWDFQPRRDAAQEYIRGHMDLEDLEAAARFPRVRAQ